MTNKYEPGDFYRICDVCGFKFRASKTRKRWDGLYVCDDDWEPRHPQEFVRGRRDRQTVPDARPEQADVFIENTTYPALDIDPTTGDEVAIALDLANRSVVHPKVAERGAMWVVIEGQSDVPGSAEKPADVAWPTFNSKVKLWSNTAGAWNSATYGINPIDSGQGAFVPHVLDYIATQLDLNVYGIMPDSTEGNPISKWAGTLDDDEVGGPDNKRANYAATLARHAASGFPGAADLFIWAQNPADTGIAVQDYCDLFVRMMSGYVAAGVIDKNTLVVVSLYNTMFDDPDRNFGYSYDDQAAIASLLPHVWPGAVVVSNLGLQAAADAGLPPVGRIHTSWESINNELPQRFWHAIRNKHSPGANFALVESLTRNGHAGYRRWVEITADSADYETIELKHWDGKGLCIRVKSIGLWTATLTGVSGTFQVGETVTFPSAKTGTVKAWNAGTGVIKVASASTSVFPSAGTVTGGTSGATGTLSTYTRVPVRIVEMDVKGKRGTLALANVVGTFVVGETVTYVDPGGSPRGAGTATVLAYDGSTMTLQKSTTYFPWATSIITGGTSGATATMSGDLYGFAGSKLTAHSYNYEIQTEDASQPVTIDQLDASTWFPKRRTSTTVSGDITYTGRGWVIREWCGWYWQWTSNVEWSASATSELTFATSGPSTPPTLDTANCYIQSYYDISTGRCWGQWRYKTSGVYAKAGASGALRIGPLPYSAADTKNIAPVPISQGIVLPSSHTMVASQVVAGQAYISLRASGADAAYTALSHSHISTTVGFDMQGTFDYVAST